jgi:hypothetical protein
MSDTAVIETSFQLIDQPISKGQENRSPPKLVIASLICALQRRGIDFT